MNLYNWLNGIARNISVDMIESFMKKEPDYLMRLMKEKKKNKYGENI